MRSRQRICLLCPQVPQMNHFNCLKGLSVQYLTEMRPELSQAPYRKPSMNRGGSYPLWVRPALHFTLLRMEKYKVLEIVMEIEIGNWKRNGKTLQQQCITPRSPCNATATQLQQEHATGMARATVNSTAICKCNYIHM